jgi:nucleoside-diphosphate-sugar epimerase
MNNAHPRVLVTGCNGFVGSHLLRQLANCGYPMRGAVRQKWASTSDTIETVEVGDFTLATDWSQALKDIDCVVHCAARAHVLKDTHADPEAAFLATNTHATLHLARQSVAAGVRRLVFVSSIGVNGQETADRPFSHQDEAAPTTAYARSKWAAEVDLMQLSEETGLQVVIVRPPLVRGIGAKGNLAVLERAISLGLPLPLGSVRHNRRDFVSIDTLCSLLELCLRHPLAPGNTFLVCDGAPLSTADLIREMGQAVGKSARLLPFPPALLKLGLELTGRGHMASQLLGNLEIDQQHTRDILDWSPPGH